MRSIILFVVILLAVVFEAQATHQVGGFFTIQKLQQDTYRVSLTIVVDCLNGAIGYEDTVRVGVFSKATHTRVTSVVLQVDSTKYAKYDSSGCPISKIKKCHRFIYFHADMLMDSSVFNESAGYYLSYERCCRHDHLKNISESDTVGFLIYAELPSPAYYVNSSPRVKRVLNIGCAGHPYFLDFGFSDPDGDSLVYSLVTPFAGTTIMQPPYTNLAPGPYPRVLWGAGYDSSNAVHGTPPLSIDADSGYIFMTPDSSGLYAYAVKVEEFRSGIKIAEFRLEYEVMVVDTVSSSGMADMQGKDKLVLFPNPATSQVRIVLAAAGSNASISMIDALGKESKVLYEVTSNSGSPLEALVDISAMKAGIYLIRVEEEGRSRTGRLVIAR